MIRVSPCRSRPRLLITTLRIVSAMIRVGPCRSRPCRLTTALQIVSAMIRVSPRRPRPRRLITALWIVSAMIGARSCRSSPRNLISRCPLVSGNWASGFISPVSALVEAGRGSNARSVLCLASELHLQQAMTSVDRQEQGQRTPDTSHWPVTDVAADVPPPPPAPPPLSDFLQFEGSQFCQPDCCQCPSFYCHLITPHAIEDHKGTVL